MRPSRLQPLRTLISAASVLLLLLFCPGLRASDPPTIAVKVEGPRGSEVREWILDLLPEQVTVLDDLRFAQALARAGLPGGKMVHALSSPQLKPEIVRIAARAIKKEELDGAILARVIRGPRLVILYVEAEGPPLIDTTVDLQGSDETKRKKVKDTLAPVLELLAPAPEPAPPPPAPPRPKQAEQDEEPGEFVPHQVGSELLSAGLELQLGGRFFSYSESPANTPNTRPYDVFGVPAFRLHGEVYPAATTKIVVLQDIGLGLSYVQAFGLESATDDGLYTFGTNWNQLWVGLSYRFRLWDARDRPPVLNVSGRYGFVNFTLEPEDDLARTIENEVPSVEYQLLRLGVDLRFPFGKIVALWPSFGVVGALQGGPVYERFTDAELACIDLGLQGVFAIDAGFEIRTGIEYTRFFAAFDPQVNDAYVAGGALDQLIALRAGAAYVY